MRSLSAAITSSHGVIPRGLARSYGDASFNSDGETVLTERLNRFLSFDPESRILESEAGVTLDEILTTFAPRGFFPPVTPGTKMVTLGGCVACDVHGKNHHKEGSISRHVLELRLLTAKGEEVTCSRDENPDLFWATVGGMGLTGCITRIRLRMHAIDTAYVAVDYQRADSLSDALRFFEESDDAYQFSVAWIDCLAKGKSLGRSVLMRGNPAATEQLPQRLRSRPLTGLRTTHYAVPFDLPRLTLNQPAGRAFNTLYFHRHPRRATGVLRHYDKFFYPLDRIRSWNRMYGRSGFVQYQCVVPPGSAEHGLAELLTLISQSGVSSFLATLKRFGPGEPGQLLSFPVEGYTLALDLPWRGASLLELLERLDAVVIEHGGRVYLAKDARMSASSFRQMYSEHQRWLEIKRLVDPDNVFRSDLARRLELDNPSRR